MKGKSKFFDALRQAKDAVEQANKALEDVMEEIGMDDLEQVTGAGNPFGNIPRPDPKPIDPNVRKNG